MTHETDDFSLIDKLVEVVNDNLSSIAIGQDYSAWPNKDPARVLFSPWKTDESEYLRFQQAVQDQWLAQTELTFRLPPLLQHLIMHYRWPKEPLEDDFWASTSAGIWLLLPNPCGPDLRGLEESIADDSNMAWTLMRHGFLQIGQELDCWYDPVCIDFTQCDCSGDMRVVRIDHEEVLCNQFPKELIEYSPTFKDYLLHILALEELKQTRPAASQDSSELETVASGKFFVTHVENRLFWLKKEEFVLSKPPDLSTEQTCYGPLEIPAGLATMVCPGWQIYGDLKRSGERLFFPEVGYIYGYPSSAKFF